MVELALTQTGHSADDGQPIKDGLGRSLLSVVRPVMQTGHSTDDGQPSYQGWPR